MSRRFLFWSADLHPGRSLRFPLDDGSEGFAIRDAGDAARAYRNVCPHRSQPVDLGDGKLFSKSGALECQAHGAFFESATGACLGGPCDGTGLSKLPIEEAGGRVYLLAMDEPHDDEG